MNRVSTYSKIIHPVCNFESFHFLNTHLTIVISCKQSRLDIVQDANVISLVDENKRFSGCTMMDDVGFDTL